jgi:hypothetical protein
MFQLLEQYYEPLIVKQLKSGLEEMCSLPTRTRVCSIGPMRDRISQQEDLFAQFFPHHKRAPQQRVQPPTGALELSFWIANSLPLVDTQRVLLLKIHSSLQRLRWELSFLSQVSRALNAYFSLSLSLFFFFFAYELMFLLPVSLDVLCGLWHASGKL